MINRLYLTRGWISDTWAGNAGPTFYNNAPGNLSKQPQGSVSYLAPGDVVIINVYDNGTLEGGHALVVNDSSAVTDGTFDLVSQNSGDPSDAVPQVSGTISGGNVRYRSRSHRGAITVDDSTLRRFPGSEPTRLTAWLSRQAQPRRVRQGRQAQGGFGPPSLRGARSAPGR